MKSKFKYRNIKMPQLQPTMQELELEKYSPRKCLAMKGIKIKKGIK